MAADVFWERRETALALLEHDPERGFVLLLDIYVDVIKTAHHDLADSLAFDIIEHATRPLLDHITERRASATNPATQQTLARLETYVCDFLARRAILH
jgi:hypothetical protein